MRHIVGVYTQRYNRLKRTDGPLFRGRYKPILVSHDEYFLQVSRYIHRHPIETKIPLVERLEGYVWSSYPAYMGLNEPFEWLDMTFTRLARLLTQSLLIMNSSCKAMIKKPSNSVKVEELGRYLVLTFSRAGCLTI